MTYSITLFCLVACMSAAEAGSMVTYDVTYASWLSQSWTTAGGTSTHGSILEASQKIDPGFIHRVTYRDTKEIGLKPFASIAAGSESTYAQAIGGLKYNFNESWGINTEVEYGTFTSTPRRQTLLALSKSTMERAPTNRRSSQSVSSRSAATS